MTSDGALSTATVKFGSATLSYQLVGAGKPLLVIHDFDSDNALAIAGPLCSCCKVFVPSLPGFTPSMSLAGEHTNSKLAWALLKFANALELKQFSVLSFGIGSRVASEMIRRQPTAVDKLVLVDPFASVKLADTLPGVMWIRHILGKGPSDPRAAREWLLDTARYELRKTLGARLDGALVIPERTDELAKLVCGFING